MDPPQPLLPATATVSLGQPGVHGIIPILQAAAKAGLKGIEIFYNHLVYYALRGSNAGSIDTVDQSALLEAAKDIRRECDRLGLTIITLQPFAQYDGLLDQYQHHAMVRKFVLWIDLAHILGCNIVQVPTNMVKAGTTGDMELIVKDIAELAHLGSQADPVISIAYESMSWGAHNNLWEHSWEVVKRVNRPNVGLCLDTYHIASRVWGDPCSTTGKTANADADLAASLKRMIEEIDPKKIFYLQLSDAERLSSPLVKGHEFYNPEQPPHMSWSRNARLFPCEEDRAGYFPVLDIARAIVNDIGYRGWVSMEIFSRHLHDADDGVPGKYADRAVISYRKVREHLGWDRLP